MEPVAPVPLWKWFLLSAALPAVFLASKLSLDLWEDEIYTLTKFVAHGPWQIVTDYSAPNNHVLYSLVLWPFYLSDDSSFVLRLPSFAFAMGTLWLVFRLAHRCAGLPAAIVTTAMLGLNQMFLVHTIQVRGYGLSMLLAAWLADLALAEPAARNRVRLVVVALVGAAFLYVIPTNALFLVPIAAVAIVWGVVGAKQPTLKPKSNPGAPGQTAKSKIVVETLAWFAAVVLGAACYAPIYRQVLEHRQTKGDFSWSAFWVPAESFFSAAGRDLTWLLPFVVSGLVCWGLRVGRRPSSHDVALPLLSVSVALGAFVLTGLLRTSPFVRNYTPLLPLVALLTGWLLAELLEAVRRRWTFLGGGLRGHWLPPAVSGVAGLLIVLAVLLPQVATYPQRLANACAEDRPQDGYLNYYAADYRPSAVVAALADSTIKDESYTIVYAKEDHWNVKYYLERAGLDSRRGASRGAAVPVVYVVAPRVAHWGEISRQVGVPEDELRGWPLLREFGYYRVYRSPEPSGAKSPDE